MRAPVNRGGFELFQPSGKSLEASPGTLDVSLAPTFRVAVQESNVTIEPYFSVLGGLSATFDPNHDDLGDRSVGWHDGFLSGVAFHAPSGFGTFLEIGYRTQIMGDRDRVNEYVVGLQQLDLRVGGSYAF